MIHEGSDVQRTVTITGYDITQQDFACRGTSVLFTTFELGVMICEFIHKQ